MKSFIISTIIFLIASYFLHKYLDEWGLDKGRSRTLLVLVLASGIAYGVAYLIEIAVR